MRPLPLTSDPMPNVGPLEIAVVLIIVLIIFGPKRLPELGQSMGRGIREFKSSLSGDKDKDSPEEKRRELEASQQAQVSQPQPAQPPAQAPPPQPAAEQPKAPEQTAETVEGEVVTENKA
jgi:sec-independent protein translocase protein TatA